MADIEKDKVSHLSILYVEDERILRESMLPIIQAHFHTVFAANDGRQGLELFRLHRPDIVITDIRMPDMDGLEMSEEIRKIDPDVPIIVLSAFNNPDNLMRAVNLGVDGFIEKSFSPDDFFKPLLKHARIQVQKKQLESATNLLEQYKKVVDAGSPVMKIGPWGRIEFVNDAFCNITGYTPRELLGRHVYSIIMERRTVSVRDVYTEISKVNHWKGQVMVRSREERPLFLDAVVVPVRSPEGNIREFITLCHDITDYMRVKEALELDRERFKQLSITDPLTGIYNRQEFNTAIIQEGDRVNRYNESLSLIIFDIDFFKKVNDEWGHQAGDRILVSITSLVAGAIRRIDIFSRIGGEEFAVLMPSTPLKYAGFVAEKIRGLIEATTSTAAYRAEHFTTGDSGAADPEIRTTVTCSFGVAQMQAKEAVETFFKRADSALYEAKHRGRNRVILSGESCEYVELTSSVSHNDTPGKLNF